MHFVATKYRMIFFRSVGRRQTQVQVQENMTVVSAQSVLNYYKHVR
jgi:hypothetical protein